MARPRSDIQPRIVEAARARFLAQGVDGASLREIARDAGTNIGMIVYYFPTKDDLFLCVVEDVYANLVRDLERLLAGEGTALDRLRGGFVRLGTVSELELDVMRLIAREALSSSSRLKGILARFMRGHVPLVVEAIAGGVRHGELDATIPLPLLVLAFAGIGVVPQLFRRAARSLPFFSSLPDAERLADLSLDLLTRAMGAPERRAPAKKRARRSRRRAGRAR